MKLIAGALVATLGAACAQAQPANQPPKDFVGAAFNMGETFGMAEALVKSCDLAVVDPKIRQGVMSTMPQNYMDTFEKGFRQGWREALLVADNMKITGTVEQKRCLLGLELYGPKGTVKENLIIRLGEDGK